jgi:hypothetical protein
MLSDFTLAFVLRSIHGTVGSSLPQRRRSGATGGDMKYKGSLLLLVVFAATACVLGQTNDSTASADSSGPIVAARCAYDKTETLCANSQDQETRAQAQLPRLPPRPPRPWGSAPTGYGCCRPWPGPSNPGHAIIGALIGGSVLAVALANTHPNGQSGPNLVGGLIGGVLGATFGAIIGNTVPSHRYYRHSWPDDDEYATRSEPGKSNSKGALSSPKPGTTQSPVLTDLPNARAAAEP